MILFAIVVANAIDLTELTDTSANVISRIKNMARWNNNRLVVLMHLDHLVNPRIVPCKLRPAGAASLR